MTAVIICLIVMAFVAGFFVAKATTGEFEKFLDCVIEEKDEELDREASESSH
jgi:uncharacterized protein YxeA